MLEGIKVDYRCTETEISLLQNYINILIDSSKKINSDKKKKLREKLIIKRYNVYDDIESDCNLPIGETYKHFEKRLLELQSPKKTIWKDILIKKILTMTKEFSEDKLNRPVPPNCWI